MNKKLKLVLCLFKYFPFGGLQRDFLKIAETCMDRGHQVEACAAAWQGKTPAGLRVSILSARGFTNHGRAESFAARLKEHLASAPVDAVVGFNKMPGLDLYFASDPCFAAKALARGPWYRLTPRSRSYLRLERAVFHKRAKTEILLLSEREKGHFIKHYGTADERFHLLPPGIPKDCVRPPNAEEVRAELRRELAIGQDEKILLMVGSGFRTKGVDRAIRGLSSLPPALREITVLLIVGQDRMKPYKRLAKRLGLEDQVRFVGGREDVPRFLTTADLLLHPAYRENTGSVLIEGMAVGLPVLATDVCGYSDHIRLAGAGELAPSPFRQETFNQLLSSMLVSKKRDVWRKKGMQYVASADVFSLTEKAVDMIERVALSRHGPGS
ncbi:MAG: glycosyltransferase family 4 protein [Deltaproteobacteria bacterium]|nr:glycosyltransferase family 4 protein [Deltaproteobacteria bacterium]